MERKITRKRQSHHVAIVRHASRMCLRSDHQPRLQLDPLPHNAVTRTSVPDHLRSAGPRHRVCCSSMLGLASNLSKIAIHSTRVRRRQ
ncbi:hypothetical protein A0H81_09262 [Grifola frondosa]|uniref:Uncharacterized protein n=1 Tax=Grifola frondosa TaxID=5627 RepID=A0A1C7M322_GRIFR|nr:hypothetical protein A0H81_09262 [Grifola frondosa]